MNPDQETNMDRDTMSTQRDLLSSKHKYSKEFSYTPPGMK